MSVRVGIDFVITWFLSVFLVRRLIFAGLAVSAYGTLVQYVRVAERTADEKVERGFLSQLMLHGQEFDRNTEPFRAELKNCFPFSYKLSGAASWNCILLPGLTTNVPAVCPYRACRGVRGELPG